MGMPNHMDKLNKNNELQRKQKDYHRTRLGKGLRALHTRSESRKPLIKSTRASKTEASQHDNKEPRNVVVKDSDHRRKT